MNAAQQQVEAFLIQEAELLDNGDLRAWLDLLAEDAYYWIPIDPEQQDPRDAASLIFETRPVIAARVERLLDPRVLPQQPRSRISRLVGQVHASPQTQPGSSWHASANFHLIEARATHDEVEDQRVFGGKLSYLLRPRENSFLIQWKRVDLVNSGFGLRGISFLF